MSFQLIVPNIKPDVFRSYFYGHGKVVSVTEGDKPDTSTFVIDYGDDEFRCRYQDGRFGSGLYFSKVVEV